MKDYPRGLTAEEIRDLVGPAPRMLEIGSHEGSDTAKFLAAMPGIRLTCFDPELRATTRFKQLIGNDPRVHLIEQAVAHVDGEDSFNPSTGKAGDREDWDFSGSLNRPTAHLTRSPEITFKPPVRVRCIRLDTRYKEECYLNDGWPRPVDFIWCDPQGAQRKVIAGGRFVLAITRYLYIECHHPTPLYEDEPPREELIALLPGFEPVAFYDRDNILFKNRHFA